ncbi:MAG: ParB/RepB/Spo0J family partition protein [Lachnospiraceae bacterium]|nr:ParB/RepB/Spo0J family partition protein [Lachnospiraceae bacterium]
MAKAKKGGLGKGLDALISTDVIEEIEPIKKETSKKTEENTLMLKISSIEPNRNQPRKNFDEEALKELADSIKQFGIIQPIIVQQKGEHYEIIAGERRWRAAKLAKLKEVPVIIKKYTDKEVTEISIIENIQRENLNPIEEAMAYKRLLDEFNLKHEEVAEKVSKSRSAISNALRLLKLDSRVQAMVAEQKLSYGHARALLAIENEDVQFEIANRVIENELSVREIEKLVKKYNTPPKEVKISKENIDDSLIYDDLAKKFEQLLSTKVNINRKNNNKGRIEIEYYSLDELERIYELINNISE